MNLHPDARNLKSVRGIVVQYVLDEDLMRAEEPHEPRQGQWRMTQNGHFSPRLVKLGNAEVIVCIVELVKYLLLLRSREASIN
jgi:hypothetical protein